MKKLMMFVPVFSSVAAFAENPTITTPEGILTQAQTALDGLITTALPILGGLMITCLTVWGVYKLLPLIMKTFGFGSRR